MALEVLNNDDLLSLILAHVQFDPVLFVAVGRVNRSWHRACTLDSSLVLKAASARAYLTKRVLTGLFGLESYEADQLPRAHYTRPGGGVVYKYAPTTAYQAFALVGGAGPWRKRLAHRASRQTEIEQTYGLDWRHVRWAPYSRQSRVQKF